MRYFIPLQPHSFDPALTLLGGQAFRWRYFPNDNTYRGIVNGQVWRLSVSYGGIRVHQDAPSPTGTPPFPLQVFHYFDLRRDYASALATLNQDPVFSQATSDITGLKLLNQNWFEVIVSFVISANNHINRISNIVDRLCSTYGTPISGQSVAFAFPTPEQLAEAVPEVLREKCGTGYRDQYLIGLARQIANQPSQWQQAGQCSTAELREQLLGLPGVGPKVSDCILLFGYGRWDVFPIDTWIRRIMIDLYFPGQSPSDHIVRQFALEQFGQLAGLAQQYLFEAARNQKSSTSS
ncbi:MAG: 8-oxoguanine DNA glycosylase [Acidobacteria bacterium]|nr:8-oxoguanine DNA glycosylase [Acidobacteriota bacterium]